MLFLIYGCEKDDTINPIPQPSEPSFEISFLKTHNQGLTSNVKLKKSGNNYTGRIPYTADITNMIATFDESFGTLSLNNNIQESGKTPNNFTDVLTFKMELNDGSVENYTVDITWFTGLPMVFINTQNAVDIDTKEEYIACSTSFIGGRNFINSEAAGEIRGRGHSTWYFHDKKPYQLKFENKTEFLGMPAGKRWIFLADHSDKTLMRNRLAFELGYLSNLDWTPNCVYAEVFVNNDYRGVYNIVQKVEKSKSRVDIGDDGYLLEIDTPDHLKPDDIHFNSKEFLIQIKEPKIEKESEAYNYIKEYIIEFENVLFSDNFSDPELGYRKYIDIESFVDWYLINEIAKNVDAKSYSSIYLHKSAGEKLKMGPLWDFDLGFGNVNYSDAEFPERFWIKENAWFNRLFEDPEFVALVKTRFNYFLQNDNYILDFIDSTASLLDWAEFENNNRWDLYGNWVWPNAVVYNSHEEEVDYLEEWLNERLAWLDDAYNGL